MGVRYTLGWSSKFSKGNIIAPFAELIVKAGQASAVYYQNQIFDAGMETRVVPST
jgi:hypothetical protein